MSYELKWEPRGVVKRFFGQVTCAELLAASRESQSDYHFDQYRYAINDFLDCTEFVTDPIGLEELAAFAGAAELSNPNIKVAIIATLPEVIAAVKSYSGLALQTYPTRLFSTLAEARAWIAEGSFHRAKKG